MDASVVKLEAGLISMGSQYHSSYLSGIDIQFQGENLVTNRMCCTYHP
ncbi:hypothetical protein RintRC_5780 [Richelia intracellularis]|nr:hypothetical protein RintRC_5780 [Richelia intracellularis]